jgi:hypothetical protein
MSELTDRVAAPEMALVQMLTKCSWAKRQQSCSRIDCHCMIARRAFRPTPTPRSTRSTKPSNGQRGADMRNVFLGVLLALATHDVLIRPAGPRGASSVSGC